MVLTRLFAFLDSLSFLETALIVLALYWLCLALERRGRRGSVPRVQADPIDVDALRHLRNRRRALGGKELPDEDD